MALGDFRAVFLPYCLSRQKDGRYAVLNREYKPVGFFTRDWVTYEKHPVLVKLKITKALANKVSVTGKDGVDNVFLYNDATNPLRGKANMDAYLAKLALLAKLRVA